MAGGGELIAIEDWRFGYPGRDLLFDELSLALRQDEQVGIVGGNGSGKTTFFRLLLGLLKPTGGTYRVSGQTVRSSGDYAKVRRRLGFLFQDSDDQLFCPTVEEDVAFGPLNLGESKAQATATVRQVLADLHLEHLAERVTYQLSGGEKRQVALATALAMRPEVLLLDEPTGGLDPRARRELVEQLARVGRAQLIASHNMEFVRATCRRVVLLGEGRIIADGETDAILGNGDLMLRYGLEVPYSLVAEQYTTHDHHHGIGPSHGHGHGTSHPHQQHTHDDEADTAGTEHTDEE